jgi:hypothetical protein
MTLFHAQAIWPSYTPASKASMVDVWVMVFRECIFVHPLNNNINVQKRMNCFLMTGSSMGDFYEIFHRFIQKQRDLFYATIHKGKRLGCRGG